MPPEVSKPSKIQIPYSKIPLPNKRFHNSSELNPQACQKKKKRKIENRALFDNNIPPLIDNNEANLFINLSSTESPTDEDLN